MGTRLSAADIRTAWSVVHEVAGATGRDEFASVALAELAGLIPTDVTTLNDVDPAAHRVRYIAVPASFPIADGLDVVLAELAGEHPLIAHHARSGDGSAIKISDFVDPVAWRTSEIYRRFFDPLGVEHQMSITLPAPAPIVVGIAFSRSDLDFSERDRAALNLVRPHLAQSWRRARDYDRLDSLLRAATHALGQAETGVIIAGEPVHELTNGALVSLYRFFGRPTPRDPFPARVRHWLSSQRAVRDADNGVELSRPLRAVLEGRQLVLRYLPGHDDHPEVLLLDEQPAPAAFASLPDTGLTERETTVLRLLAGGATNAGIAARLSLSPWTVKRHLSNIYAKLGVTGRVQATAVALDIDAHHRGDHHPIGE